MAFKVGSNNFLGGDFHMKLIGKKLSLLVCFFVSVSVFLGGVYTAFAADGQVKVTTSVIGNSLTPKTDASGKSLVTGNLKATVNLGTVVSKLDSLKLGFKYWDVSNPNEFVTVEPEVVALSTKETYSFEYPISVYVEDDNTTYNCFAFAVLFYENKDFETVEGDTLIFNADGAVMTVVNPGTKPSAGVKFNDVASSHWASEYISELADKGITNGYPGNLFKPDNQITRAEAVVMVLRAAGIKPVEVQDLGFTDNTVIKNSYSYAKGYIKAAVDRGIIKGYSADNTFKPGNSITREDLAVILGRTFALSEAIDTSSLLDFVDGDTVSTYAKGYVAEAIDLGIINGYSSDNTLRPQKNVTRAEMAKMLIKCLEY